MIFRYFNVAGANPEGEVGEFYQPETHLILLMLDAIGGKRDALMVFGSEYDTPDGTCIRDYEKLSRNFGAFVEVGRLRRKTI